MTRGDGAAGEGAAAEHDRTFEEIVADLEAVTEQLAGGQIGIEAAADLYERAEVLHAQARARLDAVQARVDRLGNDRGSQTAAGTEA